MRKLLLLVAYLVLVSPALASGPNELHVNSIGLAAPIEDVGYKVIEYEGQVVGQWLVPAAVIGWHDRSAQPGEGSNVVLNGHNPGVFSSLGAVHLGDDVTLVWDGRPYHYTVTDKRLILAASAVPYTQMVLPTEDERLTIITCWGERRRLVVTATP
jgi:sortase A